MSSPPIYSIQVPVLRSCTLHRKKEVWFSGMKVFSLSHYWLYKWLMILELQGFHSSHSPQYFLIASLKIAFWSWIHCEAFVTQGCVLVQLWLYSWVSSANVMVLPTHEFDTRICGILLTNPSVYKLAIFMTLCWSYPNGDPRCGIPPSITSRAITLRIIVPVRRHEKNDRRPVMNVGSRACFLSHSWAMIAPKLIGRIPINWSGRAVPGR